MFRKKAQGQKVQLKESWRQEEEVGLDFEILHLRIETSYAADFYCLFLSYMELLNLPFGSAGFFTEYKIICLRLDSRGQNLSGVNGSHFILTEKLLQQPLFSVYEAELLKCVNSSVLIAGLLVRLSSSSAFASYCFVPFSSSFVREVAAFH